jgi:hypothetical protein
MNRTAKYWKWSRKDIFILTDMIVMSIYYLKRITIGSPKN